MNTIVQFPTSLRLDLFPFSFWTAKVLLTLTNKKQKHKQKQKLLGAALTTGDVH